MRKLRAIVSVVILTGAAAVLSAPAVKAARPHGRQSCPEHWVGVPCNTKHYCNYTGNDWNIPGCQCDLTNFCEDGG